jgi:hypothetical protein
MPAPNTIQWTATVTQEALKDIVKEHFTKDGHQVQSVHFNVIDQGRGFANGMLLRFINATAGAAIVALKRMLADFERRI